MWRWQLSPPCDNHKYSLPDTTPLPVSATAHSSRWLSLIRLRVPCPLCWTSRIQTSGSRVWVRASRVTPPSPRRTNLPCDPDTYKKYYKLPHSISVIFQLSQLSIQIIAHLVRHRCIAFPSSSSCCDDSLHSA